MGERDMEGGYSYTGGIDFKYVWKRSEGWAIQTIPIDIDNAEGYIIQLMSKVDECVEIDSSEFNELPLESGTEGVQQLLAKYQSRNKQLLKALQTQKKNNEHLKEELRQLNDTLTSLVVKIQPAQKAKPDNSAKKEEVTKRELDNEMKKTASLKKQTQALRARLKVYQAQNLQELQNELRQKQKVIEDLHQNLKLYQKIGKVEMNQDIYRKEEQAQQKIKTLSEEIIHLKKKNLDQKKAQEQQEKSMKSQQQQLQNIEGKSKSQQKVYEVPKETYSLLQQENQQLKEHLESSENTRKNLEKTLKAEADIYKNKLRTAEKTINDLREELTRKERDFSILIMKMKQTGSLEEEKDRKDENLQTWTPPSLDCRRELKGLTLLRPGAKKFDDSDALPSGSDYRISKLTFRYFQQHIVSLTTEYQLGSGSKQVTETFSSGAQYQNLREAVLQLSDYEYIKQWEIYCGRWIEFMKVRTSKEQTLEVGNERNALKCKRHCFEIHNYEKPIAFFGLLEKRNVGQRDREVLVGLGMILKKKQILNLRSKSLAKLDAKRSSTVINDKNLD